MTFGNYSTVFDPDGDKNGPTTKKFSLNDLGLTATVSDTEINEGDTVTVNVSAIRGNSPVTLMVNDEARTHKTLDGNAETSFDVTLDAGDDSYPKGGVSYNLTVVDNQTGVESDTDQVNSEVIPQQSVEFENIETDQRGDVISITLDTDNDQVPVTLSLGTKNDAYQTNVSAYSNNGTLTLNWNTFEADANSSNNAAGLGSAENFDGDSADGTPQWSVSSGNIIGSNVTTQIQDGDEHIIAAGTYEMEARIGGVNGSNSNTVVGSGNSVFNSSADEYQANAVGVVSIESRSASPQIDLWKAPSAYTSPFQTASVTNISEFVENGTLNQGDSLAKGDVLVAQIQSEGLEGAEDSYGFTGLASNPVDQSHIEEPVLFVNTTQDIGSASNVSPQELLLSSSGDYSNAVANAAGDTYYVVYNTGAVGSDGMIAGEDYNIEYRLSTKQKSSSNFGLVSPEGGEFSDEVVTESFSVQEGSVTINKEAATDNVVVENATGQSVSGTSTYAPGTSLSVRLQAKSGSPYQFIKGPFTTQVEEDGTWEVDGLDMTSDTAGVSAAGSTFTVSVTKGNTEEASADGEIRGPRDADLTYQDPQDTRGEVITVDSADLNYGGFVVVKDASGNVLGNSDYIPVNKIGSNIRIPVDTLQSSQTLTLQAHVDSNGNEEFDAGTDEAYPSEETVQANLEGANPDYQLSELDPQSATVTVGDTIEVSATVTNEGNEAGEQDITLTAGGQTLGTEEDVSLDPGASDTVTFSVDTSALDAGSYTHTVSSDDASVSGSLTVESDSTQTTTTEPTTSEPTTSEPTTASGGDGNDSDGDDGDGESGPGFGIVVAVMALLAAALLAARRNE